jgi:hypothetical protein
MPAEGAPELAAGSSGSPARRLDIVFRLWHESRTHRSNLCCPSGPTRTPHPRRTTNLPSNPKENITMLYKTICLGLLEQRPELYGRLRKNRTLLSTLNRLAKELKSRHEAWIQELIIMPGSDSQTASEAMELAVKELEDRLSADSEEEARDFLDSAMASLRPTPPA